MATRAKSSAEGAPSPQAHVTAEELAARLGARRSGRGWVAQCPAHDDRKASLSIAEGDGGRTLVLCRADCETEAVIATLGLTMAALMPAWPSPNGASPPSTPEAAPPPPKRYMIRDAKGELLAVHVRLDTPQGKKVWWQKPDGTKRLPAWLKTGSLMYGLEQLAQTPDADAAVTEGEKAADALRAVRGLVVLGTVGGASVTPSIAVLEHLRGRRVYLWPDNDPAGHRHMERIALILTRDQGCEVRVIDWAEAPPKSDAADCDPALYPELMAAAKPWKAPIPKTAAKAVQAEGDAPWLERGHLPRTDLGNCQRFVAQHGDYLRYVATLGWFEWNGKVWAPNDAAPYRRAAATVRSIYQEAADEPDKYLRDDLAAWAKGSESASRLAAIVALATYHSAVVARIDDFNCDPWLFNCLNGTIDLRTGELAPHRREDLITMVAPVEFDPQARFEPWDRFLEEATGGDREVQRYLQKCVGYTLTGDVSRDEIFVVHGPGGTGKSTFIGALMAVTGPYGAPLRTEAVLSGNSAGGHNEDIARLVGKRLVVLAEASANEQLREGLVKQLTGGDRISASLKGKPNFEFEPVLKLWLASNHVPRMPEDDSGMQRRLRKLPFEHKALRPDPTLRHVLSASPEARAAILAWAVEGCLTWQKEGLKPPEVVTAASKAVFEDQDPLSEFWSDYIELDPDQDDAAEIRLDYEFESTSAEIRAAYEKYADAEGIPQGRRISSKGLAARLKGKGCSAITIGHDKARGWRGVRVRSGPASSALRTDADGSQALSVELANHAPEAISKETSVYPSASVRKHPFEFGSEIERPVGSRSESAQRLPTHDSPPCRPRGGESQMRPLDPDGDSPEADARQELESRPDEPFSSDPDQSAAVPEWEPQ